MKKQIAIMALALGIGGMAQAQTQGYADGKTSLEVQFNPFTNSYSTFRLGTDKQQYKLKAKFFIKDKHALRVGLGLGINNKTSNLNSDSPAEDVLSTHPDWDYNDYFYSKKTNKTVGEQVNKSGSFGLDLGYEYHFLKKGRVDAYAGAQIGIYKGFASGSLDKTETTSGYHQYWNKDVKDYTYMGYTNTTNTTATYDNRTADGSAVSEFGFDFNIISGVNYYVSKHIYLGLEIGLGIGTAKTGDSSCNKKVIKDTFDTAELRNFTTTTTTNETFYGDSKSTSVKFYAEPALRLGWNF